MTMHSSDLGSVKTVGSAEKITFYAQTEHTSAYTSGLKRTFDTVLVLAALPIVLPVVLLCAVLVTLRDGHAPFYSQMRIGKDGRHYRIWKLRTMVPHAKEKLAAYLAQNPEAKAEWDLKQKLTDDFRITSIGHILRKSSIDELPQLFNVLKGDMSLVGPRPMMPEQECDYYGTGYYKLRPGITGFWQISRRNNSSFSARAKYDDEYYRAVSFGTDIWVLLRTVRVVLRGTGC